MTDERRNTNPRKRGAKPTQRVAQRQKRVIELIDQGHNFTEIAVLVDVSPAQARRDYYKALSLVPAEAVHQHRLNHNERLEWLWEKTSTMVDTTGDPAAVNAAVNVLKRQAALNGIDAPQVIHVDNGIDVTKIVDRIKALTTNDRTADG